VRCLTVAILLVAALLLGSLPTRSTAEAQAPYRVGDYWVYATNLTEDVGLSLDGTSRIEVVRFGSLSVQGSETPIAELLLTGGGTFSGSVAGVGTARGTWSITGTEAWETQGWKSVRSFFRLTVEGELVGPTPLPFALSVTNETTRRTILDGWTWPAGEGTTGAWSAHWNASQNVTFQIQGAPALRNATWFDGDERIAYAREGRERITVPAGAFETQILREEGPEGGHRLRWYASAVGNDVHQEEFNGSGARVATASLVAYAYAAAAGAPTFPWVLAFNGVLGVTAVALLVAVAVRRRRRHEEFWMPPEPGGNEAEKPSP